MIVNLPRRIEFSLDVKEPTDGTEEEKELFRQNYNYINQSLWYWDTNDKSFTFALPPTIFTNKPFINYKQYIPSNKVEYKNQGDSQGNPLRKKHLEEIWRKGQFSIPSKIPDLPYVWKLTSFTVKGIDNVKESYLNELCASFTCLYLTKYRFMWGKIESFSMSIWSSLYSFYDFIYKVINIFLGLPMFKKIDDDKLKKKINHDNLINFINENPQINLFLFTSKTFYKIYAQENLFNNQWSIDKIEKERELIDTKKYSRNEINRIIHEYNREVLLNFLNTNEEFQELNRKFSLMDFFYSKEIYNIKKN